MTAAAFQSSIAGDMGSYLELKRSLGMKMSTAEKNLGLLDRFLVGQGVDDLSRPVLEAWLETSPELQASTRALRLSIVRQFCLFRRRTQPAAFVPDKLADRALWPLRVPRHRPHIFTTDEVKRLLRAAQSLRPYRSNPHRAQTHFNLLLLLYTTGVRISEAHALRIGDFDWSEGTLLVRESKFFKTRIVPIASDVRSSLRRYQGLLERPGRSTPDVPFFQKRAGMPYTLGGLQEVGLQLMRDSGLKPSSNAGGPRLHDLRHSFAVACIARWYGEGRDVQNLLPRLATYMGHKNIASTQYYLTITADILQLAGDRFEKACAPGRRN